MSRCLFSLLHHRMLFCLDSFSAKVRKPPCELNNVCALTTTTESRAKVWCGKMHSSQINPLEVKTNMHFMCGSRNFCQGAVQNQLTTFFVFLSSTYFTEGVQWFISKENYNCLFLWKPIEPAIF